MCFLQLGLGAYLSSVGANDNSGAVNQQMVDIASNTGNHSQLCAYASFFQCCDWTQSQPWVVQGWDCRAPASSDPQCPNFAGFTQSYCLDATASWISSNIFVVAILSVIVSIIEVNSMSRKYFCFLEIIFYFLLLDSWCNWNMYFHIRSR